MWISLFLGFLLSHVGCCLVLKILIYQADIYIFIKLSGISKSVLLTSYMMEVPLSLKQQKKHTSRVDCNTNTNKYKHCGCRHEWEPCYDPIFLALIFEHDPFLWIWIPDNFWQSV